MGLRTVALVVFVVTLSLPGAAIAQDDPLPADCPQVETFSVLPGEHPHDVAPAADGNGVWYTAQGAAALGLLDPKTGQIQTIPLGAGSAPHGVIVGPDDAAWVTDSGLNAIVRVDAESLAVDVFPLPPDGAGANLNTAVFADDGVLWFTGQSGLIGSLDPQTGQVRVYPAPEGRGPYGIATTPDGSVWYVSLAGSYLAEIVREGDAGAESVSIEVVEPATAGAGTRRVWSDSSGALWVSEWEAGQVGRYVPATGEWREWPLPGENPQAYAVYVDDQDVVWLTDFGGNALVRFDPATETFLSLPLADPGANVRQLLGRRGEVWGAESGADKLVVVRTGCLDDTGTPSARGGLNPRNRA
jgi:virginiamycin B lyase